jgi:GNAT superfamily N-acetyltransferase
MVEVRFREFRKGDMDALYFLNQRCYAPERRQRYSRILDTLLDRDVAALVAEEVEEGYSSLIGGLIVQGDPWNRRLFIVSLMVDAPYRRLGIARRLLAWAERLGESFNCAALLVPLEAGNEDGAAFLAAQGFHESDEETPFFAGPEEGRLWLREAESDEPAV